MAVSNRQRSHFDLGPDYRLHGYSPQDRRHLDHNLLGRNRFSKPEDVSPRSQFQSKPFEASKFEPNKEDYKYKPYKPSAVGLYGDKPRQAKPYQRTSPRPEFEKENPQPVVKHRRTFKSYALPAGPDIRLNPMGPEYAVTDYKYKGSYRPVSHLAYQPRDPLTSQKNYLDNKPREYRGNVDYRLTKDNNFGMRHWWTGFVDDTVCGRDYLVRRSPLPERKYIEPDQERREQPVVKSASKPKAKPKPESPKRRSPTPPLLLPVVNATPVKKTFATAGTSTYQPSMRSTQTETARQVPAGTQYEGVKSRTIPTQTQTAKTTSNATQCLPPPAHTAQTQTKIVRREQNTQTSPLPAIIPAPVYRQATPQTQQYASSPPRRQSTPPAVYGTPPRQTPESRPTPGQEQPSSPTFRRSPSPELVPLVAAGAAGAAAGAAFTPRSRGSNKSKSEPYKETPKSRTSTTPPVESRNPSRHQQPDPAQPDDRISPTPAFVPVSSHAAPRQQPSTAQRTSPQQPAHHVPPTQQAAPQAPPTQRASPLAPPTQTAPYAAPTQQAAPQAPPRQQATPPRIAIFPTESSPRQRTAPYAHVADDGRHLPPEVVACIEAYDEAHPPEMGKTIPSVRRTLHMAA